MTQRLRQTVRLGLGCESSADVRTATRSLMYLLSECSAASGGMFDFLYVTRGSTSDAPSGIGDRCTRDEPRFRALVRVDRAGMAPACTSIGSPPDPRPARTGSTRRKEGIGWDRSPLFGSHSFTAALREIQRSPEDTRSTGARVKIDRRVGPSAGLHTGSSVIQARADHRNGLGRTTRQALILSS